MKKIEEIYQTLLSLEKKNKDGVSAGDISVIVDADRANVSRYLNQLSRNNRLKKINGRPVLYKSVKSNDNKEIKRNRLVVLCIGIIHMISKDLLISIHYPLKNV